jgi:tetraacyldisaccharide 4'-kinase
VHLFCGVAAPASFRHTVESLGAEVTGLTAFPDHHGFNSADMAKVRAEAGISQLLCTEKDAAKIAAIPGQEDVLCLVIEMRLLGELPRLPGFDD